MSEETRREITGTTDDTRISEEIRRDGLASFGRSFGLGEGGKGERRQMGEGEEFGWTGIIGMVRFSPLLSCLDTTLSEILDPRLHAVHRTCPFAAWAVCDRRIQWSR